MSIFESAFSKEKLKIRKVAFMNSNEPLHARDINNLVGALLKAKGVIENE